MLDLVRLWLGGAHSLLLSLSTSCVLMKCDRSASGSCYRAFPACCRGSPAMMDSSTVDLEARINSFFPSGFSSGHFRTAAERKLPSHRCDGNNVPVASAAAASQLADTRKVVSPCLSFLISKTTWQPLQGHSEDAMWQPTWRHF